MEACKAPVESTEARLAGLMEDMARKEREHEERAKVCKAAVEEMLKAELVIFVIFFY